MDTYVENERDTGVTSTAGRQQGSDRWRGPPLGQAPPPREAESARPRPREATIEIEAESAAVGPVWLRVHLGAHGAPESSVLLVPGDEIVLGGDHGRSALNEPDGEPSPRDVAPRPEPQGELALCRLEGGERCALIEDRTVSSRHCRVHHAGAAIEVVDLGSRNGVRVSGVRVPRASLSVGGSFQIGNTTVRVEPNERTPAPLASPLPGLVGTSTAMQRLAASARRVAGLRLPVLLRGESGTGKDLVARAIHDESARASRPFVAINAAAISRELCESELFGHLRGAFTGAIRDRRGAFREAHGGTLFLDEVGSISLEIQVKLLRVVEEGMVRPLGAEAAQAVDVRLLAATCEPLEQMVSERRFRPDLYERLAVCVVHVPALRDRKEDLPALARHLLCTSELGTRVLSPGALAALRAYAFPGNVRELRNIVVQAAVRANGRVEAEHVAEVLLEKTTQRRRVLPEEALRIFEESGRNISAAARRAELPRSTLRDMLRSLGAR